MSAFENHVHAKVHYYLSGLSATKVVLCLFVVFIFLSFVAIKREEKFDIIYRVALTVCYTAILCTTVIGRQGGVEESWNNAFSTLRGLFNGEHNALYEIGMNVLLFIPLGVTLSVLHKKYHAIVICFISSIIIECVQGFFHIGYFEFADIIDNTVGGLIGVLIISVLSRMVCIADIKNRMRKRR